MESHFFVDVHCHPSIKAYARSYHLKAGEQSKDPRNRSSFWHQDAAEEVVERVITSNALNFLSKIY